MSDTVKLIIEIPKEYYEIIKHEVDDNHYPYRPFMIIANGIPLDDVKAEIGQGYCMVNNDYDQGRNYGLYMATQILDNIGKEESEV